MTNDDFLSDLDDPPPLPRHYDPPPHERQYVRENMSGELGWLVRREGKDCVKMDRPNEDIYRPFLEGRWQPERPASNLSDSQIAMVAHAADAALCRFIGMHGVANRDWLALTDRQKARWRQEGPLSPDVRRNLYAAIQGVLKAHE